MNAASEDGTQTPIIAKSRFSVHRSNSLKLPVLNEHRVSDEGLELMFENELGYCLKSFAAFSVKAQNNAQYKLIINQFYSLFKKYDGHLDEVLLLEKTVEAGEKLLSIKGFHILAKERCFEEARARMEGSSFGVSMQSSLSALVTEPRVEELYRARPRRTFGNLLTTYFNLKYRIEYGILVSSFLSIIEFDYGLKSSESIQEISFVLDELQKNVEFAYKMDMDDAIWVVVHGMYHFLEITKFALHQTKSNEIMSKLNSVQQLLIEGDLFKSKTGAEFHQKVYLELFQLHLLMNDLAGCHKIVCDGLLFFLDLQKSMDEETGINHPLERSAKQLYILALALKTSQGFKIPDRLLSLSIPIDSSVEVTSSSTEDWDRIIKVNESIKLWYRYDQKKFPADLKYSNRDAMVDSLLQKIQKFLPVNLDLAVLPSPIDCQPDQSKKQTKAADLIDEPVTVSAVSPTSKMAAPISSKEAVKSKQTKKSAAAITSATVERKKGPVKEESEDAKMKRVWLSDFSLNLALFETVEDKLYFIVSAIQFIVPNTESFKFIEKLDEKREQIVFSLLDMGFDLTLSLFSDKEQMSRLILMSSLARYFFHFHQWWRLNQVFLYMQRLNLRNEPVWREIQIRVAIVNFTNSFQTNRKVFFDSASQNSVDLNFSQDTKHHTAVLCALIGKNIDTDPYNHMYLDVAIVFWAQLEPFFRRVKSSKDVGTPINESVLEVALFTHTLFCRIPYFPETKLVTTGLALAFKLALLYESMGQFERAVKVLSSCEKNIERAREHNLGSCSTKSEAFTADISFMSLEVSQKYFKHEDGHSAIRREFACFHVDVHCALYRCKLKDFRQKESAHILQKQQEIFKLKHIHVQLDKAVLSSEEIVKENCGNDPTRRALFLMIILNLEDQANSESKQKIMERIREYLVYAKSLESSYLKQDAESSNAPILLKRSGNMAAISVPLENRAQFSIFCSSAEKNIGDVIGSSIGHIKSQANNPILLKGLTSNCLFDVYYLTADSNGTPIRSATRHIISCLPLHLPLCWTYFSEMALFHQHPQMSNIAKNVVMSHIVQERKDIHIILKNPEQVSFTLKEESIIRVTGPFIGGFAQMIFSHAEHEKKQFSETSVKSDLIKAQSLRMKICIDFLLASQCANRIQNSKLELLCTIKAYQECTPFLEQGLHSPFIVQTLLHCHSVLISRASDFEGDRAKGLAEFLVPITYYLVDQLLKSNDTNLIGKIFAETAALINITASSVDTKIHCSNAVETNLIGFNFKVPVVKTKKCSSHYYADHGYHGVVALSKVPSSGFQVRKLFDVFFEQLELTMAKFKIQAPLTDAQKKPTAPKRSLDNITSLKDIYSLFLLSGPEIVVQELTKFKKNPRYVEVVSELIQWCLEKDSHDPAIRFSYDLEDWIDKRTQALLHLQELTDDSIHDRKEIVVKRKKRQLFAIGQKNLESIKLMAIEKTAVKPEKGTHSKKANQTTHLSVQPERSRAISRPKSTSSVSAAGFDPPSESSEGSSRSSSKDKSANAPRAQSPGRNEIDAKKGKKNKAQLKFNYFNGMPQPEREKKERAAKVLDNSLSLLWRRIRYRRRLRAVLDFDSPWRANALNARGRALIAQIRKDGKTGQIFELKEQQNAELFEFRKSGGLMLKQFTPRDSTTINFELFQAQNQLFIDALQSLVQSIVLASRAQEYLKVLKFSKSFWNAVRVLFQNGKLDSEFWRMTLWKAFMVVGEIIMTTISYVRIFRQKNDNSFLNQPEIDVKNLKKANLPIESLQDLYEGVFFATWTDKYRIRQLQQIDLCFCGEFLLFSVELLHAAAVPYRVVHFAKHVQSMFDDAYGSVLAPLIKYMLEKDIKQIRPNSVPGISGAIQTRSTARYYASTVSFSQSQTGEQQNLLELSKIAKTAENYYEEAIKVANKEEKFTLSGYTLLELGDFLFRNKKVTAATVYWEKGINSILRKDQSVKIIRQIFPFDLKREFTLADCEKYIKTSKGVYNALILANTFTKIARFVYTKNHDAQSDLIWTAAHLVFSALSSTITNPTDYFGFSKLSCNSFVQNSPFFNDKFLLDPVQFSDSLTYLAKELIQVGFGAVSFPLISLAESISIVRLDSISLQARVSLLKCEAFVQMGMLNEAFGIIQAIARIKPKSEENLSEVSFNCSQKPFNLQHLNSIKNILGFTLSERIRSMFPSQFSIDFELCKLKAVLSIFSFVDIFADSTGPSDSKSDVRESSSDFGIEALDILKSHCYKAMSTIQQSINLAGELPIFDESDDSLLKDWDQRGVLQTQLIKSCDILSKILYARKSFHDSLQWGLSVRKYISKFKPQQYLYNFITAKLGRKFLLSNREVISHSYIAVGEFNMAFKIIDEATLLYEKWKSIFSAGALCLLKFKSLDANQSEGFERRIQSARDELESLAKKLEDHPFGLAILPQIYDSLVEEIDLVSPSKFLAPSDDEGVQWARIQGLSQKSLKYDKIWSDVYMKGGESLQKYSKDFAMRRIRGQRLDLIVNPVTQQKLLDLSNSIEEYYPLNKSYCRLILFVAAWNFMGLQSKDANTFAKKFLADYLKKSIGSEFLDSSLVQKIYIALTSLETEKDLSVAGEYFRKAIEISQSKPFVVADVSTDKIPIDVLIEMDKFKTLALTDIDLLTTTEAEANQRNIKLAGAITDESLNIYIAKLEKDISNSTICPFGIRYNNLLSKWRKLRFSSNSGSSSLRSSKVAPRENEKGHSILLGWLTQTSTKSDQVSQGAIDYLERLTKRFIHSDSEKLGKGFRSPRDNIVKPKTLTVYHSLVLVAKLKVATRPPLLENSSKPPVLTDLVASESVRPKSGKKRPGSSKLNPAPAQVAPISAEPSTAMMNASAMQTKVLEVQLVRHVPEVALAILQKATKQLIIALSNFEVAEDEAFKEEATELWAVILNTLAKLVGGSETEADQSPKPAMTTRNGILVEKLLDHTVCSGWIEPPTNSAKSSTSNVANAFDKDSEFFRWILEKTPEFAAFVKS